MTPEDVPPVAGTKPVVLLTERISAGAMERLSERAELRVSTSVSPADVAAQMAGVSGLIVRSSPLTAEIIDAAPDLKVIGRHGAGIENIDLEAATQRGIPVVHTPGANAGAVAEFVVLAALTMARRLIPLRAALVAGELGSGSLPGAITRAGLLGHGFSGRTIGIVGFGAIGRRVAALLEPHDVTLLFHDPFLATAPPGTSARPTGLSELLAASDIVTLHVPLTDSTRHLLSDAELVTLRPGTLVINTARAEVVDTAAMLRALDAGSVAGYAVDVYEPEPPSPDDPLLSHPKVLATPHMAAMTVDAMEQMADVVVTEVLRVLDGERPRHVANPRVYR